MKWPLLVKILKMLDNKYFLYSSKPGDLKLDVETEDAYLSLILKDTV